MILFWERFLGLYFLIVASIWLVRRESMTENLLEIVKSKGNMVLSGIIALFFGLAIVLTSSTALVSILGILAMAKGVVLIAAPQKATAFYQRFLSGSYQVIWLLLMIGLGGILTYLGFAS